MTTGKRTRWGAVALVATVAVAGAVLADHAFTGYGNVPEGVATNYLHDLYNRDYEAACALFTDQLRRRLGDCQGKLRAMVAGLPFDDRQQLGDASARTAVYSGTDVARVYTKDIRATVTVTKRVRGTPNPVSSPGIAIVGYFVTNGKGLVLQKEGGRWEISDCGL